MPVAFIWFYKHKMAETKMTLKKPFFLVLPITHTVIDKTHTVIDKTQPNFMPK
jgi:hypothetical protein